MNVAISSIRTKNYRVDRYELVNDIQKLGYNVKYIGRQSKDLIHTDYDKYNVQFLSVPMSRSNINPFKEIKTIIYVRRLLKKQNINCLIVYGIRTFPAMVIAARLAGVKKILCIVNGSGRVFQLKGLKGFLVKFISYPMLWLSFLLSNSVLFQNSDDQTMIQRKGLLWRKNHGLINGSGVNIDDFKPGTLTKNPTFIMISRLTGSKGVNEYIKAAIYVKEIYPEAFFYLVGRMDDEDSSIDMPLFNNAINDKVINFVGEVEDVRPYIQNSRVFVHPSYYPEGVPRSILEAMAMGRPIITTNVPGCRETVIQGKNGFMIPPKDCQSLIEKMIWMIENPKRVCKMSEESRKISEKKFNIHKINKKILESINLI